MATENKFAGLIKFGQTPDIIHVGSKPIPTPGPGEVLVRMTLRPVNPSDGLSLNGHYPGFQPKSFPAVPGLEGTGKIESFGPGASGRLAVGQRVVAFDWETFNGEGTYQQYKVVKEEKLVAVPDAVPDQFAAAALINPVTILGMLEQLALPAGETLLVTAGGSSLNLVLVKLAKSRGLKVISTTRRAEAKEGLLKAGYDEVIVTEDGSNIAEAVKAATGGRGAGGALDSIGGPMVPKVGKALAYGGKLIVYGVQSGAMEINISALDLLLGGWKIQSFWVTKYLESKPVEERRAVLEQVLQLNVDGIFTPEAGEEVEFEKAGEVLFGQFAPGRAKKYFIKG